MRVNLNSLVTLPPPQQSSSLRVHSVESRRKEVSRWDTNERKEGREGGKEEEEGGKEGEPASQ